jgi:hypothetical protein
MGMCFIKCGLVVGIVAHMLKTKNANSSTTQFVAMTAEVE